MIIRAWIIMLILGIVYHATNWHWYMNGHTVILALSYWWCLLIAFVIAIITPSSNSD